MMKAKAEVNSRASPHYYTHSLQQLTGCSELFSTRHKNPQRLQNSSVLSHKRGKKSIKAEWKVFWGKKLICLLEKLQNYTALTLRNIAEQFMAGVSSQQNLLRGKAAQVPLVPLLWDFSSDPALFLWFTSSLAVLHLKVNTRNVFSLIKSGGFTDFIKEFTSLAFFPTFCLFFSFSD